MDTWNTASALLRDWLFCDRWNRDPRRREIQAGAYLVMRNRSENDGAGRGTKTVDDHHLARATYALIFIDVCSDPAARVLHNPNRRVACSNSREQGSRRGWGGEALRDNS